MLILSRRIGESLMVDGEVIVTVLGMKGNQVRIGVNAPKVKAIHREEIFHKVRVASTGGPRLERRRGSE